MNGILQDLYDLPLILCGCFYTVLCVFSIVTGLIYLSGKRELNPLELSDRLVSRLDTPEKRQQFAGRMGAVTIAVGLVQGLTAWAIFQGHKPVFYWIAVGFTVFSICSAVFKLKSRISAFPLIKLVCYALILFVLLQDSSRALFFM